MLCSARRTDIDRHIAPGIKFAPVRAYAFLKETLIVDPRVQALKNRCFERLRLASRER